MNYVLIGLIAVVLLGGLIAFGVGHKRWSWGTLVGAILVLLSATGYLYVASRMAAYEWSWTRFVRGKQVELARVRDALQPNAADGGRLARVAGEKSIPELQAEQARWERALSRVDTWQGRSWSKASFEPPAKDGTTGRLELAPTTPPPAADGEAPPADPATPPPPDADKPPLDPGSIVYIFDDVPAHEGGRYLGAFSVTTTAVQDGRFVLTVEPTDPRDAYDAAVWSQPYDSVTVYESLPPDRWTTYSKTPDEATDAPLLPEPKRQDIDAVEAILDERDRQKAYLEEIERDGKEVADKDEWKTIRARLDAGEVPAGSYWASVTFTKPVSLAPESDDQAERREFAAGEKADLDLQTAFALEEQESATIDSVRYRRPLRDARTFIHGSHLDRPGGAAITADGVAHLMNTVRAEIESLVTSRQRLVDAHTDLTAELKAVNALQKRLEEDLVQWRRDAAAADRMTDGFTSTLNASVGKVERAEQAIVSLANEYRAAVRSLVRRIDEVAPPPARP